MPAKIFPTIQCCGISISNNERCKKKLGHDFFCKKCYKVFAGILRTQQEENASDFEGFVFRDEKDAEVIELTDWKHAEFKQRLSRLKQDALAAALTKKRKREDRNTWREVLEEERARESSPDEDDEAIESACRVIKNVRVE